MPTHYLRFALIIATSTAIMLVLMYLNTYALDHVFWSETRFYMAPIMGRQWPCSCCFSCSTCTTTSASTS